MQIAAELEAALRLPEVFAEVNIAPPGFINLRIRPAWLRSQMAAIVEAGSAWGHSDLGRGVSVQVEFVSSNPTGPLLFSHGRGAVVGDVVGRVLQAAGFEVQREYYLNDLGRQVRLFGESILARTKGNPPPEGGYSGEYIGSIAEAASREVPGEESPEVLADFGISIMLGSIKEDLDRLDIKHDHWFSERSLYRGWDAETMELLRKKGRIEEHDGAIWFKTGTEKDEVLFRRDGYPTYFASDVFYHRDKLERRGFQRVVDVWGADHQGQVARVKLALEALGIDSNRLDVLLIQLVSVKRGEEAVRMSRRAGVGISLKEMLDEVGPDAVRYFFLLRSADAQMEFDVDLARRQSNENPVYYAQYAHARLANVAHFAGTSGVQHEPPTPDDLERLDSEYELELLRIMLRWPDVVREAAQSLEPHRLAFFTDELAAAIHRFYKNCRVVTEDEPLTRARLLLAQAARTTVRNSLGLMGVAAPERM
jgi:arginyl-tRNA synthetase